MFGARRRTEPERVPPKGLPALLALGAFIGVCLLVSAIGGTFTARSVGTWYQALHKPSFNPPDWVFGPVWFVLYVTMGVAAWMIWRRVGFDRSKAALRLFAIQLLLNLLWSLLFFGLRAPGIAFVELVLLAVGIAATIWAFWRIHRVAACLLVPYLGWVLFAGALNLSIWLMN